MILKTGIWFTLRIIQISAHTRSITTGDLIIIVYIIWIRINIISVIQIDNLAEMVFNSNL